MIPRLRRALVAALIVAPVSPALAQAQLSLINGGAELRNGATAIQVMAITDDILRVRIGRPNLPEDASWAVSEAMRHHKVPARTTANGFATRSLSVSIDPHTSQLVVADLQGRPIVADSAAVQLDGEGFTLRK